MAEWLMSVAWEVWTLVPSTTLPLAALRYLANCLVLFYSSGLLIVLFCSLSHVPTQNSKRRRDQSKSQGEGGREDAEGLKSSSASLDRRRRKGDMKAVQGQYSQPSSHRSLQRPAKKSGDGVASAPAPASQDDSSVVWLGRYPQSFVAAGPVSILGPASSYELSEDFQESIRAGLERKYGVRAQRAAVIIQRAYRKHCMDKKFRQVRNTALRKFARLQSQEGPTPPSSGRSGARVQPAPHFFPSSSPYRPGGAHVFLASAADSRASPSHRFPLQNGLASPPVSRHPPPRPPVRMASSSSRDDTPSSGRGISPVHVPAYSSVGLRLHRYNVTNRAHTTASELRVSPGHYVQRVQVPPVPHHYHNQDPYHFHRGSNGPTSTQVVQVRVSKGQNSAHQHHLTGQPHSSQPPSVKVHRTRSTSAERTSSGTRVIAYASGVYSETRVKMEHQDSLSHNSDDPYGAFPQGEERVLSSGLDGSISGQSLDSNSHSHSSLHNSSSSGLEYAGYMTGAQLKLDSPNRNERRIQLNNHRPASSRSGSEAETPTSASEFPLGAEATVSPQLIRARPTPVWIPQPPTGTSRAESPIAPLRHHPHATTSDSVLSRSVPDSKHVAVKDLSGTQSATGLKKSPSPPGKPSEIQRKRHYRIALNFFNKKPDRGMQFLIDLGFAGSDPASVAKFLLTRRGLSKQMIGEYLGNLQNSFNGAVLECFVSEIDLSGLEIDVALRKFQTTFRLPGEAQKIERIMEVFAHHYCHVNPEFVSQYQSQDTVFILAFAVIMLNTDLHSPNIKEERRMKLEDFVKNLRGIDGGRDVDQQALMGIYKRVKEQEFRSGTDHTTQVLKVDLSVVGKKPTLPLPHRRLVCYCRLYEIEDASKKQSPNIHQREIFLFNDLILITKIVNRKKNVVTYGYRQCHSLVGMQVQSFKNQYYQHGLKIVHTLENKVLLFHARSEDDKIRFLEDLRESIIESDEMEALRIELELEKQSLIRPGVNTLTRTDCQRDSGLPDLSSEESAGGTLTLRHRALSNSMLELAVDPNQASGAGGGQGDRRASLNSLDSGMSSTASVGSRESSPQTAPADPRSGVHFPKGLFPSAARKSSAPARTAKVDGNGNKR